MPSNRFRPAGWLTLAAMLATTGALVAPVGARAGALMDALSPHARRNVGTIVRYGVAYDHCRADFELDDGEADAFVAMLSEAVQELPQYPTLDVDGRKVLLLNLVMEMQREAAAAPVPDCAVARIGGKRVLIDALSLRS